MKKSLLVLGLFASIVSAHAIEFTVQGINGQKLISKKMKADLTKSVGVITVAELTKKYGGVDNDPVEADEVAVTEIAGLRTQFIKYSDGSERALGWCYQVNGANPDDLADEVFLKSQDDKVRWYFGSVTRPKNGQWETVCRPVNSWDVY